MGSWAAALVRLLLRPAAVLCAPLFPSPAGRRRAGRAGPTEDVERPRRDRPPLRGGRVDPLMATAAAAPALVALTLVAAFAASDLMGWTPLSYQLPSNVAEAAALGLGSEVRRFVAAGQDPRLVYAVRPDAISTAVTRATALEAAVWSRSERLIRMLDRMGSIDAPTRQHMACLADDIRAPDIKTSLTGSGVPTCVPGAAFALVQNHRP
jgi:hypothetical protein